MMEAFVRRVVHFFLFVSIEDNILLIPIVRSIAMRCELEISLTWVNLYADNRHLLISTFAWRIELKQTRIHTPSSIYGIIHM